MTEPGPTPKRPYRAARAGRGLLTALVGVLLVLAGIVVGAVPAAAQNAVGASIPALANTVGPPAGISAGQRLGNTAPQPQIVVATAVAADTAATGWRVGDPIENLTKAGNSPSWSTVRARYWKNTANDALDGEYRASNLTRMQAGKPPLHDELGVPMELNHITPRWQGGGHTLDNLEPLWPWEHAAVDPFRFDTGPTP